MPPESHVSPAASQTAKDLYSDAPLFAGLEGFSTGAPAKSPSGKKRLREKKPSAPRPVAKAKTKKASVARAQSAGEVASRKKGIAIEAALLSVAEMCKLLGISRATLVRMDNGGKIPGRIKLGGSVRYHREVVDAWLKTLVD